MQAVERVRALVEPIVASFGVELYDVEHESGILRIMVDRPGGIDVDTVGDLSKDISTALDEDDPLPDSRYLLEVSSPGIERKLRLPEHYKAQLGEQVNLKVAAGVDGPRRFEARLDGADDSGIDISVATNDSDPTTRRLAYTDIEAARTVFHWGEQTQPEPKRSRKKSLSGNVPGKAAKNDSSTTTKKEASNR